MLSMYVNRFHSNWSRLLNLVTFAYNTTPHFSTEMSPFKLRYGREPVFPKDIWFGVHIPGYEDLSEYAEYIKHHWPDLRDMAKAAMQKAQEVYTNNYNQNRREVEFDVDSLVLIHTPTSAAGLAKKFLHNFKGPYKVTKKLSPLVYQVRRLRPPFKEFSVSVQRMKPYVVRRIDEEEDILTFIPSLMPLTPQGEAPKDSTNLQDEQL